MGAWRERLERRLAGPIPREDPMERIRRHNKELLAQREMREWTTVPDKVSAATPWKPSRADRIAEEMKMSEGRPFDRWGLGTWNEGDEDIDDVVRRQDRWR